MKIMKTKFYILGISFLVLFLSSCLDGKDTTTSTIISDEAVVSSFYLYSDSIKGIEDYVFIVDNDSMLIYNYDSIDYGTRIDSLSFILNPRFSSVYINDTLDYYLMNKVYLDFTKEVKFTVVASDEKTSADYRVKVNVHQVDPDTFVWKGVKSEVFVGEALTAKSVCFDEKLIYMAVVDSKFLTYESVDGSTWVDVMPSGLDVDLNGLDLNTLVATEDYISVVVDGKLYRTLDGKLWSLMETTGVAVDYLLFGMNGKLYGVTGENSIARLDESEWVDLGALPSKFPVEGGAVLTAAAPSGKSRVFVVGGIDSEGNYLSSVWSSEDGMYWSEMTGGKEQFTPRAYAAVAQYGGGLMLFGGVDKTSGSVVADAQLFSKDFGLTWSEPKAKSDIGELYVPRYEHSVVTTPVGYIYLIGGRASADGTINDVWQGLNYASLPGFRR